MKHLFYRLFYRFPIRIPLFSFVFFCLLLWLEPSSYTLLPLLAALLHEAGHLCAMLFCGRQVRAITIYPFGVDIQTQGFGSYRGDLWISIAGVIANLLACAFCAPHLEHSAVRVFFYANLLLAVLNLLPIETLDGGALLCNLLSRRQGTDQAQTVLRRVSFLALLFLWVCATYLLFFTGSNFSFFTMTLYLFACLFLGKPHGSICENKR